jgi:1,4-alpha-glucan branching enzyme
MRPGEASMKKAAKKQTARKELSAGQSSKKAVQDSGNSGIKKLYLESGLSCRVSFRLPKEAADGENVTIVGDFNDWNTVATPMKRLKNGDFGITLELKAGRAYNFRYLIDGNRWENDWHADRYEKNPYGEENSVVEV